MVAGRAQVVLSEWHEIDGGGRRHSADLHGWHSQSGVGRRVRVQSDGHNRLRRFKGRSTISETTAGRAGSAHQPNSCRAELVRGIEAACAAYRIEMIQN